jgi:hypothetical protein
MWPAGRAVAARVGDSSPAIPVAHHQLYAAQIERVRITDLDLEPVSGQRLDDSVAHPGRFQGHRPVQRTMQPRRLDRLIGTLAGNLADLARHHTAGKRDVRLEQSLHQALEESSIRLEGCLKDNDPTPPEQIEHNEQVLLLIEALEHFPEDQRNDPTDH